MKQEKKSVYFAEIIFKSSSFSASPFPVKKAATSLTFWLHKSFPNKVAVFIWKVNVYFCA